MENHHPPQQDTSETMPELLPLEPEIKKQQKQLVPKTSHTSAKKFHLSCWPLQVEKPQMDTHSHSIIQK